MQLSILSIYYFVINMETNLKTNDSNLNELNHSLFSWNKISYLYLKYTAKRRWSP